MRLRAALGLVCDALSTFPAVRCSRTLGRRLHHLWVLHLEPTLHLLQPEIRRGVDRLEHDARGGLVLGHGGASETRTFANHAVLEVSDLDDALPIGGPILCQLCSLDLEEVAVDGCSAGRKEDL